ncbi:uncharacterized protein SPSK_02073 [Sporothrix schenckii 1099-18]|uniref:Uncharacterized protein n=1 Tax=Sporothrix schenckii 1099-18 TaxID=1397361 RepID=A0A0F2MEG7_SPOSC|nr:uncharacterized protein SPSK_02073 [Sporothrix schenckii 1099-18]KJR87469.1 hypothetical protein SPSK_02073 [Sporothrix schenckii 1099-18]
MATTDRRIAILRDMGHSGACNDRDGCVAVAEATLGIESPTTSDWSIVGPTSRVDRCRMLRNGTRLSMGRKKARLGTLGVTLRRRVWNEKETMRNYAS